MTTLPQLEQKVSDELAHQQKEERDFLLRLQRTPKPRQRK